MNAFDETKQIELFDEGIKKLEEKNLNYAPLSTHFKFIIGGKESTFRYYFCFIDVGSLPEALKQECADVFTSCFPDPLGMPPLIALSCSEISH
jgi:hypothetical protein